MIKLKNILSEKNKKHPKYNELALVKFPFPLPEIDEDIISEYSQNDPIQEINKYKDHLAIFAFGPPATGKSTFIKNEILTKTRIKVIDPDEISKLRKKLPHVQQIIKNMGFDPSDPSSFDPSAKDISIKYFANLLHSGENILFDTTGNQTEAITDLMYLAEEKDYHIVFIHMIGIEKEGEIRNTQRDRHVDIDYLKSSYKASQGLIKYYSNLNPESYYIILHLYDKYYYYKYKNNTLLKKKGNQYV